ncbi:hypothetical protein HPB47_013429 [Ixodes persulcatus]|uniref:Uncharacterized protein n=1 Tax=Ixodes persulcatus TaxID=34615 RepID=A0AC60R309_IXOPE|nr:hypothetical protein HPB47_013429 [Ixodes persulcatus]
MRSQCASFNARTGLGKAWRTYRGMNKNKRKSRKAAQNLGIRLKMTEEELAVKAGQIFFPHIPAAKQGGKKRSKSWAVKPPKKPGMDEPLNMGALLEAIHSAKQGSAPGPDGITYTALSNLPGEAKEELLKKYNETWKKGKIPDSLKISWVTPIPKPGKTQDRIENFRPVSLRSSIFKVLKGMVLQRVQWYLETYDRLDPRQTELREAKVTPDRGFLGDQEFTMQRGIDEVAKFSEEVEMEPCPEKTQYLVVARPKDHRKGIARQAQLRLMGKGILERRPRIKILGVTPEGTAGSTKWLPELKKVWGQALTLIRRTVNRGRQTKKQYGPWQKPSSHPERSTAATG